VEKQWWESEHYQRRECKGDGCKNQVCLFVYCSSRCNPHVEEWQPSWWKKS
jgi:hypothetical protein